MRFRARIQVRGNIGTPAPRGTPEPTGSAVLTSLDAVKAAQDCYRPWGAEESSCPDVMHDSLLEPFGKGAKNWGRWGHLEGPGWLGGRDGAVTLPDLTGVWCSGAERPGCAITMLKCPGLCGAPGQEPSPTQIWTMLLATFLQKFEAASR